MIFSILKKFNGDISDIKREILLNVAAQTSKLEIAHKLKIYFANI